VLEGLSLQFSKGTPCLKKPSILPLTEHVTVKITSIQRSRRLAFCSATEQDTEDFTTGLFLLLTSFCGLQELELMCKDCEKVHADGITNHGEALTGLFIVNGGIDREDASGCFSVNDLEKVATACTELKYLCLNLYEIDTGRLESDILGPQQGAPFQPSEFEQALYAIETILKLRSLHITNPSNYRKAFSRPREFFRWHARSLQNSSER
jgi:hypothetical protein